MAQRNLSNLVPGQSYTVKVEAIGVGELVLAQGQTTLQMSELAAPATVTGVALADKRLKFDWAAVAGSEGYEIAYSPDYVPRRIANVLTDITVDAKPPGDYRARVRAYISSTTGEYRESDPVTVEATVIGVPASVTLTVLGDNRLRYEWTAVPGASGYFIAESPDYEWLLSPVGTATVYDAMYPREPGTYKIRVCAFVGDYGNRGEYRESDPVTVSALDTTTAPSVGNIFLTDIMPSSATFKSTLLSNGMDPGCTKGFVYSSSNQFPTLSDSFISVPGSTVGEFSAPSGARLQSSTTYYIRAYAQNSKGTQYSSNTAQITVSSVPIVTLGAVTDITATSAKVACSVTGGTVTAKGFVYRYGGSGDATVSGIWIVENQSFYSVLASLQTGTEYFVKAFATNAAGTAWTDESSFTPVSDVTVVAPQIGYVTYSNVTSGSADVAGLLVTTGGDPACEKGFVYSSSDANPTKANSILTVAGSMSGFYSGTITGLNAETTYYVRAYAQNSEATVYSPSAAVITTLPDLSGVGFPSFVQATVLADNRIKFDWSLVSGADGYEIAISPLYVYGDVGNITTTNTPTPSEPGTYWVRVRAYVGAAKGDYKSAVYTVTAIPEDYEPPIMDVIYLYDAGGTYTMGMGSGVISVGVDSAGCTRGFVISTDNPIPTRESDLFIDATGCFSPIGYSSAYIAGKGMEGKRIYARSCGFNRGGTAYSPNVVSKIIVP